MKGRIITLLLFCIGWVAQGQIGTVRPDQFPLEPNPNNTNFEVYSQKNGVNRRATLNALRTYMLQGISAGPPGPTGPQGPAGPKGDKGDKGDAGDGAAQDLSDGGRSGVYQVIDITGGAGVSFSVADMDNDSINEIQVLTIDSTGVWTLNKDGGTGDLTEHIDLTNDTLTLWSKTLNLKPYINRVYETATVATRDTLVNVPAGSVAIIADGDGTGLQGLSFYDTAWTVPVIIGRRTSIRYTVTHGSTTAVIWATGTGVTIVTNMTTGEIVINVPGGVDLHKVHITLPFGAVDGSNNYYIRLAYTGLRSYNTSISTVNLPSVMVGSAVTGSMSRSSPVIYAPDGNAGVDIGISAIGGGDGSDLEIAVKDFLIAAEQFVTLIFSTH